MTGKALIVQGGWEGHDPQGVANVFARELRKRGLDVEISNTLDSFLDADKLTVLKLVVPVWTMGQATPEQMAGLTRAVGNGVGIGGCHGGMCDAFRMDTEYQFMTGGQFVSHPGGDGTRYLVKITDPNHDITRGLKDFEIASEQYYMHVDPAVKVLATTPMPTADGPHVPNGKFEMPVMWTKYYGKGRVFYCSLGHNSQVVEIPPVLEMMTRGLVWAAGLEG